MSLRLSIITTRTGDDGTTGLGDGSRLPKDAPRVHAIGDVDELNSMIGLWRTEALPTDVDALLNQIQNDLFDLGGELCIPGMEMISDADVERLEQALDGFNADLPVLKEFILPGGSMAASTCHLARTVCRRAERAVVTLAHDEDIRPQVTHYLNRLSDLLFVVARVLARHDGHGEVLWQHERRKKPQG